MEQDQIQHVQHFLLCFFKKTSDPQMTERKKHISSLAQLTPEDRRTLKGLVAAVMCMQLITPFLQSGTAVILPAMGEHFQCSATSLGLVSTVYCMALAIFNLAMGRAGDKWGRHKVCMLSMVILAPTSILIALVPDINSVIALRFFQGVGTAAFCTSSLAMLMAITPAAVKGRILGTTSTATYVGLAAGPLLSGWINTLFGWTYFFYIIASWSVICFIIMAVLVRREWYERREMSYDWTGLFLFAVSMITSVQGFVGPMPDSARPVCIVAGILVGLAFCVYEYRLKKTIPLLDIKVLIHNRIFILSNLASFSLYASLFSLTFFLSLYLQYVKGLDSAAAGTVVFIQPVTQILLTLPSGWLTDRVGAAPVALVGNVMAALSLAIAIFLGPSSPMLVIFLILVLNGLGNAFFVTPNTVMIMSSVDPAHLSQASGLVGTVRTAGMVVSMVTATLTLRVFVGEAVMSTDSVLQLVEAMQASFIIFSALSVVSLLLSIVRYRDLKKM